MRNGCKVGILFGVVAILVTVAGGLLLHRTKDDREVCCFSGDGYFGL